MPKSNIDPIHPGEILLEEFMEPLALKAYTLSKKLEMPLGTLKTRLRSAMKELRRLTLP